MSTLAVPRLLFITITAALLATASAQQEGKPWTGERGVTQTTAALMQREKAVADRPKPYRMMPEHEVPDRHNLPQNPASRPESGTPARSRAAAREPAVAQTASTNFLGATLSETGSFPPDTMGTVGPTQFVVAVNGRLRSFNKTTGVADGVLNTSMDTFFASVMTPPTASNFTSDPRIRYDRLTKRWIIIIIDVPGTTGNLPNRILLAVSDADSNGVISGSTVWTYYYFQQDLVSPAGNVGEFADYPTLGVDVNALYIGCNMFGTGFSTSGFVVRKSSIMSGGPIVVTAFRSLAVEGGSGPVTPQGVDNFDPAATEGYFIGPDISTQGTLVLRRITNPGGTPTISANIPFAVNTTAEPVRVPHSGNTGGTNGTLDALDTRLYAAHIRGGKLWTAHNISVGTNGVALTSGSSRRDAVRWYQLNVPVASGTPTVAQSGTIFDATAANPRHYWIPSVMVSGQGHAALGFSTAGTTLRIDASRTGRLSGDAAGVVDAPTQYTASATAYNPANDPGDASFGRRWGDYSYTSLDPNDDMTMWTIQEYCNAANSYGVRILKLLAPLPATPSSASPASVQQGASNASVTITGTSTGGTGFFDPGAGFANHIGASVSGTGVTVNSVTYTDPTHATLNLSVAANAAAGARNVTITNPDGQSSTSVSGILTIVAPVDLAVSKSALPDPVVAGYNLVYTVTVSNLNVSGTATNVVMTDTLPANVTFVSATSTTGTVAGTGPVTCTVPTLAAGASFSTTITIKPNALPQAATSYQIANNASVAGSEADNNPTNNSMMLNTTVLTDSDADGMSDQFEIDHQLDKNSAADAALDRDGDGFTNVQEFVAGTDIDQATSALRITDVQRNGADTVVTFSTVAGKKYIVERADNLPGPNNWTALPGTITGTGSPVPFTDVGGASGKSERYYRLRIVP